MSLPSFIPDPICVRDLDHEIKESGRAIFATGSGSPPSYFCPFSFLQMQYFSHMSGSHAGTPAPRAVTSLAAGLHCRIDLALRLSADQVIRRGMKNTLEPHERCV